MGGHSLFIHRLDALPSPGQLVPVQTLNLSRSPPPQVTLQSDQGDQFSQIPGHSQVLHCSFCLFSPGQETPEQDRNLSLAPPPQVALQADQKVQSIQIS